MPHVRFYTSTSSRKNAAKEQSIADMLATPSWSVSSLLPPKDQPDGPPPITSKQLHHLLRLSALPPPSSPEEEESMMDTLAAQLHFVREMQKVDTTGIEPLRAIRDETKAAQKAQEITLDTLKDALSQEEVVGRFYKRIRRKAGPTKGKLRPEGWHPLSQASRTSGKFFVVDSGKGSGD
jgi:Asp-tRNA(Asn)/Glu-tRNA(Gln) amidotransferase C subunit